MNSTQASAMRIRQPPLISFFRRFVHHRLGKTETVQDVRGVNVWFHGD